MFQIAVGSQPGSAALDLGWIDVYHFATGVDQASISAGTGNDVTYAVTTAIAALPAKGGVLYFRPGRFVTTGSFTISVPCTILGCGGLTEYTDATYVSQIEVSNGANDCFILTADEVMVRDLAIVDTAVSRTAGSAIRTQSAANYLQNCSVVHCTLFQFFIGLDIVTGAQHYIFENNILNAVSIGLRIQNTLNIDAGNNQIVNNQIAPASNVTPGLGATGIVILSAGGTQFKGNSIIRYGTGTIKDGIKVDFSLNPATQQMLIQGNQIDFVSGYAINMVYGVPYVIIDDNYFGCGHSTQTAFLSLNHLSIAVISNNTWNAGSSTVNSIAFTFAINCIVLPQPVLLPVSYGATSGTAFGDVDMGTFKPLLDLSIGPLNTVPGTLAPMGAANSGIGGWFQVQNTVTVSKAEIQIGISSGNICVAIYSQTGLSWVASSGSVACPAAGIRDISFTAPVTLNPGTQYYVYIAADNTTATFLMTQLASASGGNTTPTTSQQPAKAVSTFPLPSSGNAVAFSGGYQIPIAEMF